VTSPHSSPKKERRKIMIQGRYKMENEPKNEVKQFPKGHFVGMWMGICMAIFAGIGVAFSIALKRPGFIHMAPGIGVAFGLAIGSAIEAKKEKEGLIRPLTDVEKKQKKKTMVFTVFLLTLGLIVFAGFYFFR
jgi:hypothetical protein